MKVFNATGWGQDAKVDSKEYYFEPFGIVDIFDDHAQLLLSSADHKDRGFVPLDYDRTVQLWFPNFESFKKEQAIKGLKGLLSRLSTLRKLEISAKLEADKYKNSPQFEVVDRTNVNQFDKDISLAMKWLKIWEDYKPPNYVESKTYVDKNKSQVLENFDPSAIASKKVENEKFYSLPENILTEAETPILKQRGRPRRTDESVGAENASA